MLRTYSGLLLAALSLAGSLALAATPATPAPVTPPPPSRATASHGELLDRVVAIVNDGVVLESELETEANEVTTRLRNQKVPLPSNDVMRSQVLDRLVLEEIQAQRADRAGIKVSDEQVNAALEDIATTQQGRLSSSCPIHLPPRASTTPSTATKLRREIAAPDAALARRRPAHQHHAARARSVPRACRSTSASAANEYNVSHILIAVAQDATPAQLAQAHQKAHDVDGARAATARTSASSRSPTRPARRRSRAARSAGARAPSCRLSWPMSSPA